MDQKKLIEVLAKSLGIASNDIAATTSLMNEIGVDSIEMVRIRRDLIKNFKCDLDISEIKAADTIEKIFLYIQEQRKAS